MGADGIISGEHLLSFTPDTLHAAGVHPGVPADGAGADYPGDEELHEAHRRSGGRSAEERPDKPICLRRINITEIDALTGAVEDLPTRRRGVGLPHLQNRGHVLIPIGVCEAKKGGDWAFCSRNLLTVLDCPSAPRGDAYLPGRSPTAASREITRRGAGPGEEQVFRPSRGVGGTAGSSSSTGRGETVRKQRSWT